MSGDFPVLSVAMQDVEALVASGDAAAERLVTETPPTKPKPVPPKQKASPLRHMTSVPPDVSRSIAHKAVRIQKVGPEEFKKWVRRAKIEQALAYDYKARNAADIGEAAQATSAFLKLVDALTPKAKPKK